MGHVACRGGSKGGMGALRGRSKDVRGWQRWIKGCVGVCQGRTLPASPDLCGCGQGGSRGRGLHGWLEWTGVGWGQGWRQVILLIMELFEGWGQGGVEPGVGQVGARGRAGWSCG